MFDIFVKRKTIVLDAFTENEIIGKYYFFRKGNEVYPSWWKNLPKQSPNENFNSTMKGCYGFLELYKRSFIQPLWMDILVKGITKVSTVSYNERNTLNINPLDRIEVKSLEKGNFIDVFNPNQYAGLPERPNSFIYKLLSPWLIQCKEDIDFASISCEYDLNYPIQSLAGMMNFKYQNGSNLFLRIEYLKDNYVINAGTNLRHLVPITDKKIKFVHHVDAKKVHELSLYNDSIQRNMYSIKKLDKLLKNVTRNPTV